MPPRRVERRYAFDVADTEAAMLPASLRHYFILRLRHRVVTRRRTLADFRCRRAIIYHTRRRRVMFTYAHVTQQ